MKGIMQLFGLMFCGIILLGIIAFGAMGSGGQTSAGYAEPDPQVDFVRRTENGVERSDSTTDEEIKWMQTALNCFIVQQGLALETLEVDGSFGPASEEATVAFREAVGLHGEGGFDADAILKMKQLMGEYDLGSTLTLVLEKDGQTRSVTELNLRGEKTKVLTISYTPGG